MKGGLCKELEMLKVRTCHLRTRWMCFLFGKDCIISLENLREFSHPGDIGGDGGVRAALYGVILNTSRSAGSSRVPAVLGSDYADWVPDRVISSSAQILLIYSVCMMHIGTKQRGTVDGQANIFDAIVIIATKAGYDCGISSQKGTLMGALVSGGWSPMLTASKGFKTAG
ncbi:hypothetical protein IW262DRAFT_1302449 [Armillaria fumosa]|nr:hypothetical protein IW262DRAFT_1302449 [Armillaria fumosa]